jgi:hypothetical protein
VGKDDIDFEKDSAYLGAAIIFQPIFARTLSLLKNRTWTWNSELGGLLGQCENSAPGEEIAPSIVLFLMN